MAGTIRRLSLVAAAAMTLALLVGAAFSSAAQADEKSVLRLAVGWDETPVMRASRLDLLDVDNVDEGWQRTIEPMISGMSRGNLELNVQPDIPAFTIAAPAPAGGIPGEPNENVCAADAFFDELAQKADAGARERGIDPASFDLVVYYWSFACESPNPDGSNVGAAFQHGHIGKRIFLQKTSNNPLDRSALRELGAVLGGTGRADRLVCRDAHGGRLPYSQFCETVVDGDTYDIRSAPIGKGVFAAPAIDQLSPLSRQTAQLCDTCTQDFVLAPLGADPGDGTLQAVKVQDGTDAQGRAVTFWIEYRRAVGLDVGIAAAEGVVIHRQVAGSPNVELLNMHPEIDIRGSRAALDPGDAWDNPIGNLRVEYVTDDQGKATVNVRHRGKRIPDLLGYGQTDATGVLTSLAILAPQIRRQVDRTCSHIGRVMAQTPAPGTFRQLPLVTLTIGTQDPNVACPAPGPKVLFVNLMWHGRKPTLPSAPTDSQALVAQLRSRINDVFTGSAFGRSSGVDFDSAGGPLAIEAPRQSPGFPCGPGEWHSEIVGRSEEVLRDKGIDTADYDRVIYHWDADICEYKTLTINKSVFIEGDLDTLPVARELAPLLGLQPANRLTCQDASGRPVPLSGACTQSSGGDPFDLMGGRNAGVPSAIQLQRLGWLGDRLTSLAECDGCTNQLELEPLGAQHATLGAVKLVDEGRTFWLENRQPVGVDAGAAGPFSNGQADAGLVVHLEATPQSGISGRQFLLDMSPDANRVTLAPGQTWVNPLGSRTIRVNAVDAFGNVDVTIGTQKVAVPDVRGMTTAAATAALRAAGLVSDRTAPVEDPSCNLIGLVKSTTPSHGIFVRPGTQVTLNVGVRPSTPCP